MAIRKYALVILDKQDKIIDRYNLDLGYIELENNEFTEIELENVNTGDFTVNVKGVYGSFYKGETPYLEANDSPTHVFVGWTTDERINDICENFKTDDLIVSNEHIWNWETPLDRDMVIFAVYRKRKVYKVMIDFENRHSYFMVTYGEKTIMLSDKERDFIKVQEGHHFIVKCCPLISTNRNGEIIHTYNFYNWSDGNSYQTREYYADDNLFLGCSNEVRIDSNYVVLSSDNGYLEGEWTINGGKFNIGGGCYIQNAQGYFESLYAINLYENMPNSGVAKLVKQRELPILNLAKLMI